MSSSRVRSGFVPMLGHEPLKQRPASSKAKGGRAQAARPGRKGAAAAAKADGKTADAVDRVEFLHQDGTPVDPGLHKDIVFVRADVVKAEGARNDAIGFVEARAPIRARQPQERALAPALQRMTGQSGWWAAVEAAGMQGVLFPEERKDVVLGDQRFTGKDVDRMLMSLAPTGVGAPAVQIDAGFFHETLTRWLGIDGRTDGEKAGGEKAGGEKAGGTAARKKRAGPSWDYDFWKAILHDDGEIDEARAGARVPSQAQGRASSSRAKGALRAFTAEVYRGERTDPERYRYWIHLDDKGRVKRSGWLSGPPDLLSGPADARGAGAARSSSFREAGDAPDVVLARGPDARAYEALYADGEDA